MTTIYDKLGTMHPDTYNKSSMSSLFPDLHQAIHHDIRQDILDKLNEISNTLKVISKDKVLINGIGYGTIL